MFLNTRWFTISFFLLAWIAFHFLMLTNWFGISETLAAWDAVVTAVLIGVFGVAISNGLANFLPSPDKWWSVVASSLLFGVAFTWLTIQSLLQVGEGDTQYTVFLELSKPVRFILYFVIVLGVTGATVLYAKLKDQRERASREAATTSMVKEAELQKLQLQLQPHFLFNSLNSISALILVRPEEARKMVMVLSDFLRMTIRRADEQWITLKEEWNYLQLYLDIEKVRFGHRLTVETNFNEQAFECKMPSLLLQPIVENAIKFGLYGTTGNVVLKIDAMVKDSLLQILVTNPFDPDAQPAKGSGFGLTGIKRRLYLLYARNDLLETNAHDNRFIVKLNIPNTI